MLQKQPRPNRATTVRECVNNALSQKGIDILVNAIALPKGPAARRLPAGCRRHSPDRTSRAVNEVRMSSPLA